MCMGIDCSRCVASVFAVGSLLLLPLHRLSLAFQLPRSVCSETRAAGVKKEDGLQALCMCACMQGQPWHGERAPHLLLRYRSHLNSTFSTGKTCIYHRSASPSLPLLNNSQYSPLLFLHHDHGTRPQYSIGKDARAVFYFHLFSLFFFLSCFLFGIREREQQSVSQFCGSIYIFICKDVFRISIIIIYRFAAAKSSRHLSVVVSFLSSFILRSISRYPSMPHWRNAQGFSRYNPKSREKECL